MSPVRSEERTMEKLNLICFICHDLGQHLSCYGVPNVRSGNLDAFAEEGIRFANSFCTAPQCSPSRSALWTGRYPHSNGCIGLAHGGFRSRINDEEKTLAQLLNWAGYETHIFGTQHITPERQRCGFKVDHGGACSCTRVGPAVAEFLKNHRGGPFYIHAGTDEPHRPFSHLDTLSRPPEEMYVPPYLPDIPECRRELAELEASVASVDKAVGIILEALDSAGMRDDTIVLFTTDHGIAFPRAKCTLYDTGIAVSLILRVPGTGGGKVFEQMVSNVDVLPTLLELLGIEVPENVQGRSFAELIREGDYEERRAVFAEKTYHTYYDPMRCIRTKRWKLIVNFENTPNPELPSDILYGATASAIISTGQRPPYHELYELYDLESDPWEQNNLAEDRHDIRDSLAKELREWMRQSQDPLLYGAIPQQAYTERIEEFLKL